MRPAGKARGARIAGLFERRATPPAPGSPTRQPRWGGGGMQRRPNAREFPQRGTSFPTASSVSLRSQRDNSHEKGTGIFSMGGKYPRPFLAGSASSSQTLPPVVSSLEVELRGDLEQPPAQDRNGAQPRCAVAGGHVEDVAGVEQIIKVRTPLHPGLPKSEEPGKT